MLALPELNCPGAASECEISGYVTISSGIGA
jgi:hypothetical protein